MQREVIRRALLLSGGFLGAWLCFRYLLPLFLPFVLGLLLALTAEPAVQFGLRLKLPRWAAAGIGVSLTLVLFSTLTWLLGATVVKELGVLVGKLPDLQNTATGAVDKLHRFAEHMASRAPEGLRPLADRSVDRLFSSGNAFIEQATVRLPGAISSLLGRIPDGALGVGTGILSGFMLSARLPELRRLGKEKMPKRVRTRLLPALKQAKDALFGWLKAQCKLSAITFGVVAAGLLLLQIPYAPLWAAVVAIVDAVPLLGTGTILLPWALICLLQRQHLRAIGLLCIYGVAFLLRTVLEPRLVGRHLGLDPLLTLVFLYLGYRFWGVLGMLFAPMLAAALIAAGRPEIAADTGKG